MDTIYIFDLDGTLADTLASLHYSVNETLRELSLPPVTRKQCQSFVGNGARRLIELSIQASGGEADVLIGEAMSIYRRVFDQNCTYQVRPYDGIPDVLDALAAQGAALAVLSNKPHAQAVKVVETVFGKEIFAAICGQKDNIPRKPDPAGILEILKETGFHREDCLYIGDSEVDIATGKNADVCTAAVAWGFRTQKELKDAGAKTILSHPQELLHTGIYDRCNLTGRISPPISETLPGC